jgi:hypothetical protein
VNDSAYQGPQPSFHRSSQQHGSSLNEYPEAILQMLNRQRERGHEPGGTTLPQDPSVSTHQRNSQLSSHVESPSSSAPTVVPLTHERQAEKIRLACTLHSVLIQCWLHLDAPGEAFCDNVQKEFRKRKLKLDRPNTTIIFKSAKEGPDCDNYYLSLDEDDLEADWGQAIDWLRTNKRNISPHIHGTIQIED